MSKKKEKSSLSKWFNIDLRGPSTYEILMSYGRTMMLIMKNERMLNNHEVNNRLLNELNRCVLVISNLEPTDKQYIVFSKKIDKLLKQIQSRP
jgi:hypothetical protein